MLQENQNCVAVQGTNDSSIVSKCSMVKFSYYNDPFLQHFVEKSSRRSPLIHRGYYIRAKVIHHCFEKFIKQCSSTNFQIVSLGSGFDSSYFRLKSQGFLKNGIYIEIDFPDVMKRKKNLVRNRQELTCQLSASCDVLHRNIVVKTEDYVMLGVDLTDLEALTDVLQQADINTNTPTLLLSEVAITYMPATSSSKIIQWSGKTFPNATFILYEQIRPNDAFGHVMQNHFNKLSCPLLALNDFPTLESQCIRFKTAGWEAAKACDMNHFFLSEVLPTERTRVEHLEPFDEYEEWHLKCSHYMILCAFNGTCCRLLPELLPTVPVHENTSTPSSDSATSTELLWQRYDTLFCPMYGHTSTDLGDRLLCIGGFGLRESQSHGRLHSATVILRNSWSSCYHPISLQDNSVAKFERMYHSATKISESKILLIGGRTSPTKPCNLLTLLEINSQVEEEQHGALRNISPSDDTKPKFSCKDIKSCDPLSEPDPRWRHSVTCTEINGKLKCFLYGGKSLSTIYEDFWMLDVEELTWTKLIQNEDNPGCRHSHTSDWYSSKLYLSCGLGQDAAYGDVVTYDPAANSWANLPIQGCLTPRYSHTSSVSDGWLLLLGGVTVIGSLPGLDRINLASGICLSYVLPEQNPAVPIMLHGHASVPLTSNKLLVLGGGGNCFSFGTHLNKNPVEISFHDQLN